jgi:hypothetical protein
MFERLREFLNFPHCEYCRCLPKARGSGRLLHSAAAVRVPVQRHDQGPHTGNGIHKEVDANPSRALNQRVVQHLHPMPHGRGGAALQMRNAANVGRDDLLGLRVLQVAELAVTQLVGNLGVQY